MLINTKRKLMASTVILGAVVFSMAANAQDQKEETLEFEEIVVTGTRLQNQKAIQARRDSTSLVDVITSNDVGQLPDFNIGEAVRRLPGVAFETDQAEVRFITIRSFNADYNYTTVDGVSMAVPDRAGRRVFLDVLPASIAENIEVIKTFTPNQEGAAIGGILNIQTASAFNFDPGTFQVNGEIGQFTNNDGFEDVGLSGNADVFYATTFGADDQFGLVLTANYFRRDSTILQAEFGSSRQFFDDDGNPVGNPSESLPYPGNGYAVPVQNLQWLYHNRRERYGATGKFQYRPNDQMDFFIRGFYNEAVDDESRMGNRVDHNGSGVIQNQTATSGTIVEGGLSSRLRLGQFDFTRAVWQAVAGGDISYDNGGELSFRLNYSGSRFSNPERFTAFRLRGDNDGDGVDDNAFNYVQNGDLFNFSYVDEAAANDFSNYAFDSDEYSERELREHLYEAKLDWSAPIGDSDWSYGVGASYRLIDRAFDEDRDRYLPTDTTAYDVDTANIVGDFGCLDSIPSYTDGQCLTAFDVGRLNQSFASFLAANPDQFRFDARIDRDNRVDYSIDEEVIALYGLVNYTDDVNNLTIGLRWEDTRTDGTGQRNLGSNNFVTVSNEGGYSFFLPSLNYIRKVGDDMQFRAAVSRSLGRPAFNLIAPRGESLSIDDSIPRLSRSNPDLQPRNSWNFDIGFDKYIDDGEGIIGLNLFYKRVANEIFLSETQATVDIDGIQTLADITQPTNAGRTTNVFGVEFQVIKNLDSIIEGLGVAGNTTYLTSDFTVQSAGGLETQLETLIESPTWSINTSVFYDRGPFSAKLAYTWQDTKASIRINTGTPYRNRYDTPQGQMDFKAFYRFSDKFTATFNAWNILDQGRGEVLGLEQELPLLRANFGRAFFVGFSYEY